MVSRPRQTSWLRIDFKVHSHRLARRYLWPKQGRNIFILRYLIESLFPIVYHIKSRISVDIFSWVGRWTINFSRESARIAIYQVSSNGTLRIPSRVLDYFDIIVPDYNKIFQYRSSATVRQFILCNLDNRIQHNIPVRLPYYPTPLLQPQCSSRWCRSIHARSHQSQWATSIFIGISCLG